MTAKGRQSSGKNAANEAARAERSAEALRANLRRRKTQERERAEPTIDKPESGPNSSSHREPPGKP
jgi:hypothetical protein